MKMIEPIQIQLIHIAKAQLGLSDWDYRMIIMAQTKNRTESSKHLTYSEADGLINYLKTLGFKIQPKRRPVRRPRTQGNVVGLPTRDELNLIALLVKKVPWRVEDGYQRWLTKHMRIRRVATAEHAAKVIEGLKGMLKHANLQHTGEAQCR